MNASSDLLHCTVIICTRNRAGSLKDVLASLLDLVVPLHVTWELIVVDNASTDGTADVLASFDQSLPLRRVVEPRLGLSNARNAGIQEAQGRYILWTDDDVRVDPLWLQAYVESFRAWPDAVVFGGKITPDLTPPTPAWFQDAAVELQALLAARDFGPHERNLSIAAGEYPYGANFAVRAVEQRACLYNPDLGVAPGRRTGGEEYDVIRRLSTSDASCRWVPKAGVRHIIPAHRQSLEYIFTYYASEGEVWASKNVGTSKIMGIPVFSFYKMPITALRFCVSHMFRSRSRTRHAKRLAWHFGVVRRSLA